MTRYEQGFMNKCAEYGVDGRALLEKVAWISAEDADAMSLKMQNEALQKAYDYGYDRFLPERFTSGSLSGHTAKNWWRRLWSSGGRNSKYRRHIQANIDRMMDEARAKHDEFMRNLDPDSRAKLLKSYEERRRAKAWNTLSPEEQARLAPKQQPQTQPQPLTPADREKYVMTQVANGKMRPPSIAGHYMDEHGRFYRPDGRPISSTAQAWNAQFNYIDVPQQQQPQQPPAWQAPGAYNPPKMPAGK